ncbi:MAG: hypothetical protein VCF07_19515 [Nitrospinota bacterium]
MHNLGRPHIEMENFPSGSRLQMLRVVEELSSLSCSQEDAAKVVGTATTTFKRRLARDEELAEVWERGRARAKMSLRMKQFKLASRSAAMAIFLGKNYLGQSSEPLALEESIEGSEIDIERLSVDEMVQLKELMAKVTVETG